MARGDAPQSPVATSRRDEIGGVADSVNELAQSLQRLEELRRQVTNDVAHELRTPLHNLLGLIEGMRDGVIPATPARLQQAHSELGRLVALVEDLRGLADAQLARDRMTREPLNVESIGAAKLWLDSSPACLSAVSRARSRRQRRIWSLKETPAGSVRSSATSWTTRSSMQGRTASFGLHSPVRARPFVWLPTMSVPQSIDSSLPHIFERFFRADPSRTRGSGGAGIGLAIVKELVTAHGGEVGASNEAEGVTVWFELPLWEHDPEHAVRTDPARTVTSLDAASRA